MKICVFGAASKTIDEKYIILGEKLGEELVKRGHELVYGAGATGLMGAVSRGVERGGGKVIGIVPSFFTNEEVLNENCTELIRTDTMHERKQIMEHFSEAFIITPGGVGTLEELFEVFTLKNLERHNKPIVIYNECGFYDSLINLIDEYVEKHFISEKCRKLIFVSEDIDEIIDYIEKYDE